MKKIRILFVDDNADYLELLIDYFSQFEDFDVVGKALNGQEGLDIIENLRVDVVVLDVVMPNLDGLAVLEYFNKSSSESRPQFIMISAIENDSIMKIITRLGAEYFLMKPFNLEILASRIRQLQSLKANNIFLYENTEQRQAVFNIDQEIENTLDDLGVPSNLKGYGYLKSAIQMIIEDFKRINSIMKTIYNSIAKQYATTPARVERAIRNAIEITFCRGNIELLSDLFESMNKDELYKPTNSDFLLVIAKKILDESQKLMTKKIT